MKMKRQIWTGFLLAGLIVLLPTVALGQSPDVMQGCEPIRTLRLQLPAINGDDVMELQQRLVELGYGPITIDGEYGPKTAAAVRSFQAGSGLQADGVAGPATWEALGAGIQSTATPAPTEPPQGELSIVVDTKTLQLTLFADGKPYKTYPVAVGRPTRFTLSPVGEWRIVYKGRNWGGGFGTRWMGLNVPWGIYGIHGTNKPWSIGRRESAGCIRMHNRDVEQLFEWVPTGTPVTIIGNAQEVSFNRTLHVGMTGRDVVYVQFRLADLGFSPQGADGRFGPNTARAVEELQRLYGLPVDGKVYDDVYYLLGLK